MFCKKCGTEQKEGDKFCRKCGTPCSLTVHSNQTKRDTQQEEVALPLINHIEDNKEKTNQEQEVDFKEQQFEPENSFSSIHEEFDADLERLRKAKRVDILVKIIGFVSCTIFFVLKAGLSSSIWWWLVLACILFFAFSGKEEKIVSQAYRNLFICGTLSIFLFFFAPSTNNGGLFSSDRYDSEGYNYAIFNLKSPSSAKLLSYVTKKEMREKLRTIKLPEDLEVELYLIEAQNSFGGMIKNEFVVFFWKGEPIYMEEDGLDCFISFQHWNATKTAIKINTGIDVDN